MAAETEHEAFLREALLAGVAGEGRTHPNPCVGAVVVREGRVVGRGWHRGPGTPHAEVEALREAGEFARGADLYVTLEPCCTWGRTPPCTDALLASGVKRVFAAVEDPNPAVAGKGLQVLREAGIESHCPVLPLEAVALDRAYHHFYRKGRPFVHLKWAQSLDGCVKAERAGYLTGEAARLRVHEDRFLSDAILVTAGTVREDDPELTIRLEGREKNLIRVVVDREGTWEPEGRMVASSPAKGPLWVFRPRGGHTLPDSSERVRWFECQGDGRGGILWESLFRELHARRVMRLYVEGVGRFAAELLREGWVDLLSIHLAPVLGGVAAPLKTADTPFSLSLQGAAWTRAGEDWIIEKPLEGLCLPA